MIGFLLGVLVGGIGSWTVARWKATWEEPRLSQLRRLLRKVGA